MFDFREITHIIKVPTGYTSVGSVPVDFMTSRKPTRTDIMGGRVQSDGLAYFTQPRPTVEQWLSDAKEAGAKLCSSPTCACRKLFHE